MATFHGGGTTEPEFLLDDEIIDDNINPNEDNQPHQSYSFDQIEQLCSQQEMVRSPSYLSPTLEETNDDTAVDDDEPVVLITTKPKHSMLKVPSPICDSPDEGDGDQEQPQQPQTQLSEQSPQPEQSQQSSSDQKDDTATTKDRPPSPTASSSSSSPTTARRPPIAAILARDRTQSTSTTQPSILIELSQVGERKLSITTNDNNHQESVESAPIVAISSTSTPKTDPPPPRQQQQPQQPQQPSHQQQPPPKSLQNLYQYPTSDLIVTNTKSDLKIDYNNLPPLNSVRILQYNELQQVYADEDDGQDDGDCSGGPKDQQLARKCGRIAIINPTHGWYKWVVLAMTWLSLLLVGLTLSTSLYTLIFELHFNISRSTSSWYPSLQLGLFCLSNLVSPFICDVLGGYFTLAIAFFTVLWGFLISSLCTNFYAILIIHGVLVGFGCGLIQMSSLYIASDYFSLVPGDVVDSSIDVSQLDAVHEGQAVGAKPVRPEPYKKTKLSVGFAVGFVLSAFGIGNIIWSPFINSFIDKHQHYKQSFIFISCFVFGLGLIILSLIRSRTYPIRSTKMIIINSLHSQMRQLINALPRETRQHLEYKDNSTTDDDGGKQKNFEEETDYMWYEIIDDIVSHSYKTHFFNFELFYNPSFCVLFLTSLLAANMFYAPFVHVIPHSEDAAGLKSTDTSLLLIIIGIMSFSFRIIASVVIDFIDPVIGFICALVLQCVCAIVWYFSTTKGMFQFTAVLVGLSAAVFVVSVSALPKKIFSNAQRNIIPALSMLYGFAFAPAAIIVGPVMGWVNDHYGTYDRFLIALIVISGCAILLGSSIVSTLQSQQSDDEMEAWKLKRRRAKFAQELDAELKKEVATMLVTQQINTPSLDPIVEDNDQNNGGDAVVVNVGGSVTTTTTTTTANKPANNNNHNNNKSSLGKPSPEAQIEAMLRARPAMINVYNNKYMWYTQPNQIKQLSVQYILALARWRLGKTPQSGWRTLYM